MTLRHRVYRELEPSARLSKGLSGTNKVLVVAIIVAAVIAVVETEPKISSGRESMFRLLELAFGAFFLVEYAARVWVSSENPRFSGMSFPRFRYMLTSAAIIDLVAIIPALFALSGGGTLVLRFFRILRMLRLAKLGRMSQAWQHVRYAVKSRSFELGLTLALGALAMLVSGTLMYWVEGEVQPDQFGSIPRALWWSVITLTTVGYGDVFPVTATGRLCPAS
jgi:voltage-gated potassium channel